MRTRLFSSLSVNVILTSVKCVVVGFLGPTARRANASLSRFYVHKPRQAKMNKYFKRPLQYVLIVGAHITCVCRFCFFVEFE